MNKFLILLLLVLLFPFEANCFENSSILTTVGKIQINETSEKVFCELKFKSQIIHKYDCDYNYPPNIIEYFEGDFSPFSEIVVIQEFPMGNACNGGPIRILGLKKNGTYFLSKEIDFCGGPDPIVAQSRGKIVIIFPGAPPNRGEGYIPTEVWLFEKSGLKQLK